ncbi:MAG: hypothetical protein JKY48_13435 [Flavobacteriales bacterium]|nr:hypothetical protein [Flavobacteriales bacterium]
MQYISNYVGATKIFFIDQNGMEQFFTIADSVDNTHNYSIGAPCESNPSSFQFSEGKAQYIEVQLRGEEFEKPIFIVLSRTIETASKEELTIFYGDRTQSNDKWEALLGFEILENSAIDSIILNGRVFYNVIEANVANSSIDIKFNKDQGVIYIKKINEGIEYVYDRVE